MAAGALLVTSHSVPDEPEFILQCHSKVPRPFVVLALGDHDTTMYVYEPAHLVALGRRSPKPATC